MSDKVVSLHGTLAPSVDRPVVVQSVVEELERLLAAARAGEIVGFAGACQQKNSVCSYSYAGAIGSYAMIGGLDVVKARLLSRALGSD